MTTLVTGAGVIGCHTAQLLAARGEQVVLIDLAPAYDAIASIVNSPLVAVVQCDVSDYSALSALAEKHEVSRVVHTAALLSTAIRSNPIAGVLVNVMGTMNVLELARQFKMKRVVVASSTTIAYPAFAEFAGDRFPENFAMRSLSQRPGSIYSATKVTAEHLALLYRDLYGVSTVSLRYAAVVSAWKGPGTSVPGRILLSLVLPARNAELAIIDDAYLLWKGGDEFVDARDCARANVAALDSADPAQGVYNISMGYLATFDEFVDAVRQVHPTLAVRLDVQPQGGFAGFPDIRRAPSDISRAAEELSWRPMYDIQESVSHFAPLLGAS